MKRESGETKKSISGAKKSKKISGPSSKHIIIIAVAALLSIGGGLLFGVLTHKDSAEEEPQAANSSKPTEKDPSKQEKDIESTGSEWGDIYAEYLASRDDLKESSYPTIEAIDFEGDGTPELVMNYSTSISNKTQIIYLDGANKAQASDGYNNARVEILFDTSNENAAPLWYLFNGSDMEYGRYASISDIISGRQTVSFISATTEISLADFHESYIEINPEFSPENIDLKTPKKSLKPLVQRGNYDFVTDQIKKNVKKEISERLDAKEQAEEEERKQAEEDALKKKTEEENEKKKAGIVVGNYKVNYGSHTVKLKNGKSAKITLNTDQSYTITMLEGNSTSSGSFSVSGSQLILGSEKFNITANDTFVAN